MRMIENYRKLLGANPKTDLKELKSAYRNLMKDCHPDKFQDNPEEKLVAEERSKKIIAAYHFLVSIAPETIADGLDLYNETLNNANVQDFEYKNEIMKITFSDGNVYEYFGVPKPIYVKMCNAPSIARFARRHVCNSFVYRSVNKLVTTA